MPTDKPKKPSSLLPRSFGGEKNNFSDDLIATGYEANTPQTYNGDNLNYQLDATGKELDYCEKVVDYINGLNVGKTPIVNANNKLDETQMGLRVYNATETYSQGEWVLKEDKIYKSLIPNNVGNDLTDTTKWKYIELGGLPDQLNNDGKFLQTDGEQASWENIPPATMLNSKFNLMNYSDKVINFLSTSTTPVTIDYIDGTTATLTNIPSLDLSNQSAGTYNIACDKLGNSMVSSIVGDLTINNGVASGFSTSNYFSKTIDFGTTKETMFPIVYEFTTGDNVTTRQTLLSSLYNIAVNIAVTGKLDLSLSSNGTAFDIANELAGTTVLTPNTNYKVVVDYDGTNYTLELTDLSSEEATTTTEITLASSSLPIGGSVITNFGNSISTTQPFFGSIEISRCSIAGNLIIDESLPLGKATLTSDSITDITNNYDIDFINPLEEVTLHTKESYKKITSEKLTEIDFIPFTFVDLDYSSFKTVTANTSYTLTDDVMVNTTALSTFTITKNDLTYTLYGTWLPVKAGVSFKSSIAGKYYLFEGN